MNINKSEIIAAFSSEYAFVQSLDAYKATLKEWQDHMRRVDADALDAKIKPIDKHIAYLRPVAQALIQQVIMNSGQYTIVDDTPTPEQLLPLQKEALMVSLSVSQAVAIDKIGSHAKQALNANRATLISAANPTRSVIQRVKDAVLGTTPTMSAEDAQFMSDHADQQKRLSALLLKSAQARSDIEDLTVTTIKSWKNPEL